MSVKYYVLAILCNISKAITFQIMEDNTRASVTLALFTHSCTYRKPEMVFADRGSSQVPHTDSQEYYQYFGGHKMMTHQYTANHQNLNQVERFIKECKKILRTVLCQRDKVKLPNLTYSQIRGILGAIQDTLNSRPIFGHETFVCANHLLKPFLLVTDKEEKLISMQVQLDLLRDLVGSAHNLFVSQLKAAFLHDKSRLQQHKKKYNLQTGDIAIFFRADKYTLVRIIKFGPQYSECEVPGTVPLTLKTIHNSKLVLVYRERNNISANVNETIAHVTRQSDNMTAMLCQNIQEAIVPHFTLQLHCDAVKV